jgi:hypothetical protein
MGVRDRHGEPLDGGGIQRSLQRFMNLPVVKRRCRDLSGLATSTGAVLAKFANADEIAGLYCRQIGRGPAGQHGPEQGVESVYCADSGMGQIDPAFSSMVRASASLHAILERGTGPVLPAMRSGQPGPPASSPARACSTAWPAAKLPVPSNAQTLRRGACLPAQANVRASPSAGASGWVRTRLSGSRGQIP